MNITVLGCGRWGSFLAWYANRIGHNVTMWGLEGSSDIERFIRERKNKFLEMPESVKLTTNLTEALLGAELCIISISSQALRSFLSVLDKEDIDDKTFLLCMKGLEQESGKRLSEVFLETVTKKAAVAVLAGPGHVQSFTAEVPGGMVVDSADKELTARIVHILSSDLIRLYIGNDLIGTEIGAAAKNVIGIAAGFLDGYGYESMKGVLMARGAREVARLIKTLGGDELSAYGLCHLGDYEATLFSKHSNNRRFGELFVSGKNVDELAEGVYTAKALIRLSEELGIEMPISKAVYNIVHKNSPPKDELTNLFLRSVKAEFE